MKKIAYILAFLLLIILARPSEAQAGCCKRIHWGDLGLDYIEVWDLASESACADKCKSVPYSTTKWCQHVYTASGTANPSTKSCISPNSGCCQINYTPDVRMSESYDKGRLAYMVDSETECTYFCRDRQSCSHSYTRGTAIVGGACSVPVVPKSPSSAPTGLNGPHITNPLNTDNIPGLVANLISAFLKIIGALALIIFVYGGVLFLTAAGNDKRIDNARSTLLWAGIGLVVVFLSYILVGFFLQTLGVI